MSSPTSRSLALLRADGYTVARVEHWNPHARVRQDLFGVYDILAIRADAVGVLGVQTTSASNLGARRKKLTDCPAVRIWLQGGNAVELHGWQKIGHRWICKRRPLTLADLPSRAQSAAVACNVPGPSERGDGPSVTPACGKMEETCRPRRGKGQRRARGVTITETPRRMKV